MIRNRARKLGGPATRFERFCGDRLTARSRTRGYGVREEASKRIPSAPRIENFVDKFWAKCASRRSAWTY